MNMPKFYIYEKLFSSSAPQIEPPATPAKYNFIGGHNDPQSIPIDGLADAAATVLKREGHRLAMYNLGEGPRGYSGLRRFLGHKLASHRGISGSPDDILVTSGSIQGLDLVNRLLIEPGDTVLMEMFSFSGALNRARAAGAQVVGVKVDRDGMRVDALEERLATLKREGVAAKYIYIIPTIQNPTGSVLSLERRHRIVELAREYGVPIFEDECYADLAWGIEAPPALFSLAPDVVVHIGSFSKTLSPALRIGYATADPRFLARMVAAKSDGGTGALDQLIAAEYFEHHFDDHMPRLKKALKRKLGVMVEALEREFGTGADLWVPQGGIFLWLELLGHVDVRDLSQPALDAGVAFDPGPAWACSPEDGRSFLRLCFALPDETQIREGISALANACFAVTGIPARGDNRPR
jgi:2-aminoadipate transaminase